MVFILAVSTGVRYRIKTSPILVLPSNDHQRSVALKEVDRTNVGKYLGEKHV